ncbi:PD-(D/E)XK motif protein [Planctomonas deserti]|uniref:PD-(D/E)XK motif protein n=1 Tax=Planctomonas deserti TaxID=2144185 RepID=UPI00131F35DC|nr:PD-(D/E)XK motif protein [Planctomonas deserti]
MSENAHPKHLGPGTVEAYFRAGAPAAFTVCDDPEAIITIDPARVELRLITPAAGSEPEVTAFERIALRRVLRPSDTREWFELAVDATDRHYEAYMLMESIADQLRSGGTFRRSVSESLESLKDLLTKRRKLTDEKVSGLIGELLVLDHVLGVHDEEAAIAAWLGPLAEQHDFGFSDFDAEVKTTLSEERSHVIGSDTQLEPVPGRPLHLISVQITRAGAAAEGFSLPDLITSVRARLDNATRTFNYALDRLGWDDGDADLYRTRFQLRSTPQAYLVDDLFPAITSKRLDEVVPNRPFVAGVSYRVDVTHLPYASAPDPLSDFCKEPE